MTNDGLSTELMRIELFGGPLDGDGGSVPTDALRLMATHNLSGHEVTYKRREPFYRWREYAAYEGIGIPFDYHHEAS